MLARPERGEGAKDLCKHSPFVRLELTLLHASPGPDTSAWSSRIWACTTPKCPHLPLAPLSCLLAAPRNTHVHFHRRPLRDPGFQATLLLLPIWAHYIRETEAKWRLSPVVPLPAPPPSPLPSLPRCHEGQCLPPPPSLPHLVQAKLPARKGEGETQGEALPTQALLLLEVQDAVHDVVKELRGSASQHQGEGTWPFPGPASAPG